MTNKDENLLGVVGFVLSLIALFLCGLLSPVALLFCLAGLWVRGPKGMALAGLILSIVGCVMLLSVLVWWGFFAWVLAQ